MWSTGNEYQDEIRHSRIYSAKYPLHNLQFISTECHSLNIIHQNLLAILLPSENGTNSARVTLPDFRLPDRLPQLTMPTRFTFEFPLSNLQLWIIISAPACKGMRISRLNSMNSRRSFAIANLQSLIALVIYKLCAMNLCSRSVWWDIWFAKSIDDTVADSSLYSVKLSQFDEWCSSRHSNAVAWRILHSIPLGSGWDPSVYCRRIQSSSE